MRDLDTKATKKTHDFRVGGKTYHVPAPTIKQLATQEQERKKFNDRLKLAIENGDDSAIWSIQLEFMVRRLEILAPQIPKSIVENFSLEQYDTVLLELGVIAPAQEEGENTKKKGRKGSRT